MKKNILALIVLSAFFLLTGCQPKSSETKSAPEVSQQTKPTAKVTPMKLTAEEFKKRIANYETHPNEWVYLGERPAVIDFYATWCGPCKMTAPIFADLANTFAGKVDFYKIDIDQQPELAGLFGVTSIPSLLFIPKEGKPSMSVGAMERQQMQAAIQDLLNVTP